MSRVQIDSGIPFRREQPQTQVVDTFVGLRAAGPQMFQPSEMPRWQSELFDVAQALGGLSGSLGNLSRTWGKIGVAGEQAAGESAVLGMTPEQQRDAAAMDWAELEKKNPELKGASPFRKVAVRQAAGKAVIDQNFRKVLSDNAERLSDPTSDEDPRAFAQQQLQKMAGEIESFYGKDAALRYGSDLVEKFTGMVEETKRKRTVLVNDQNFQSEVKDAMSERLSAEGVFSSDGLQSAIKQIQDRYHTITGESGNLAVFDATRSLADTLIANGRYDDARELIRGMSEYSHNGQVKFGKMYAEQFAELIDKADSKEEADSRSYRQDTQYKLGQAAANAMFKVDAAKLESMTEGEIKALAQEAASAVNAGPEYYGEMYDMILQMRDGQLARLNRGKDGDKEDLRLMMEIKRQSMQSGADLDALEEKVQSAFASGELKKDTAMMLLGQLEAARNHYGDNASPLVREQRERLGAWINPSMLPRTAMPEFTKIVSDLRAQFDERIIAARDEVINELGKNNIPVNADSINHHLGAKARVIADDMMASAETTFSSFVAKYEPRAQMKEYMAASPFMAQAIAGVVAQMDSLSRSPEIPPQLANAMRADRVKVQSSLRKIAQTKLKEFTEQGLEGQELYDAVDQAVDEQAMKWLQWLDSVPGNQGRYIGTEAKNPDFPMWNVARAANAVYAESGRLPEVPEEFAGFTAAGRFGNEFRSWNEELVTDDPDDLRTAQENMRTSAKKLVDQVANPRTSGIEIRGSQILRGGEVDPDATATYWNAKVMWQGLKYGEVKFGRTDEGLQIPTQYLLSPYTRIQGLDTEAALRAALVQFEADGTGPLAEYRSVLPNEYAARDIVDLLRANLRRTGVTE
jgi:hypothetical protein